MTVLLLVLSIVSVACAGTIPIQDDGLEIARAEENQKLHLFEGDIKLTDKQKLFLQQHDIHETGDNRAIVRDTRMLWPNKMIPYDFDYNLDGVARRIVRKAIREWEMNTCIRFKRRTFEGDYVQFVMDEGCSSSVGQVGGMQTITMGTPDRRCRVGNIIHEIGHSVGFFHEHSRPDRDEFVKIVYENILPGYDINFEKLPLSEIDSRKVPYDYESILHYPRRVFTSNGEPTVIPTKDPNVYIGQRIGLSALDVLQANVLYSCGDLSDDKASDSKPAREKGALWARRSNANKKKKCADTHNDYVCSFIKRKGYCKTYPNIVKKICKKTCNLCSKQ